MEQHGEEGELIFALLQCTTKCRRTKDGAQVRRHMFVVFWGWVQSLWDACFVKVVSIWQGMCFLMCDHLDAIFGDIFRVPSNV